MSQTAPTDRPSPDRFLLSIVAGTVVLIVSGIVAVLVAGRPPTAVIVDPDSPAGVVHTYGEALRAGDVARARTFLTQSAREAVERESFPGRFSRPAQLPEMEQRILIEPVETRTDTAEVRVTVSTFTAQTEPFSTNTFHREVTVRLVREDGAWRISQPIDPGTFF